MDPILALLLGLGPGVMQMLLGGNQPQQQQQTSTVTQDPTGYQSPILGLLDPLMFQSILQRLQQFSGAGMPGGVGGTSPAINDILNLLGGEWGGLLDQYGKPAPGSRVPRERQSRRLTAGPTTTGSLRA